MATKYKAYAITAPKEELQLQFRDLQSTVDNLPPEGVLVKVSVAGVCHTDLHLWHGGYQVGKTEKDMIKFAERPGMGYPKVPGHEIAGTVYTMGATAKEKSELRSGERVLVYSMGGCNACSICDAGNTNLCRVQCRDLGFVLDGGYAEYVVVPHYVLVFKVPTSIPTDMAALLPCSGLTAFSAVKKCLPVVERVKTWKMEVKVVVIGLGGLGQWALRFLRYCLGQDTKYKVIGIDTNEKKLEMAQKQGLMNAGFCFNPSEEPAQQSERFLSENDGKPHVILDFVNTTTTFAFSTQSLHCGGALIMVGLNGGLGELKLPLTVLGMYTIAGSYLGSFGELTELIALIEKHSISPPPLSHYQLDEATKALCDLEQGKIMGRAVLDVSS